ncbi:hypothetical protein TKK_0012977 [Trichogramma kaykai]
MVDVSNSSEMDIDEPSAENDSMGLQPRIVRRFTPPTTPIPRSSSSSRNKERRMTTLWPNQGRTSFTEEQHVKEATEGAASQIFEENDNVVDVEGADNKVFERILEETAEHRFIGLIHAFLQALYEGETPAGMYEDLKSEESRDNYERTLMGRPHRTGVLRSTPGHGAQEVTLYLVGLTEKIDDHVINCPLCGRTVGGSIRPAEKCELCALVVLLKEDDIEEGMVFNAE